MAIAMLKIRRPLGRLIFNMGITIPSKTVFLIETAPCGSHLRGAMYTKVIVYEGARKPLWWATYWWLNQIFKVDFYAYWNRLDTAVLVQELIGYLISSKAVIFKPNYIKKNPAC